MHAAPLKTGWYLEFKNFDFIKDRSLLYHSLEHSIFFTPEWFEAVMCWLAPNSKPVFWIYTERNKILGIVPLILKKTVVRKIRVNQLEWLRVPDSHFCGILAAPKDYPTILQAFWSALSKAPFPWHTLKFYPVSQPLGHALQASCPFSNTLEKTTVHPFIDMKSSWENYYKTRSRRLKKGNNHLANRLHEKGRIDIKHITHQTPHFNLEPIIQQIRRISQDSWKSNTQTTFNHQGPLHFIKYLTRAAYDKDWLSLWMLYLDDSLIAYEYQLRCDKTVYALRADFDETYRSLSPGSYLNWKILESLFNQGIEKYFMGPGKNAYKARWQNQSEPVYQVCVYSNSVKGRLLNSLNAHIIPKLRPLKHKLTPSQQKVPEV